MTATFATQEIAQQSPDRAAGGFVDLTFDPLRYSGGDFDPDEAAAILLSYMPSNARILDVGCGTGTITLIANAGRENEVVGLEPDPIRAAAARDRGLNVETGLFDGETVAALGTFDVVMFADVLEHLADPSKALALASSILRPGGLVLASVPNVAHWTVRRQLLLGKFDYQDSGIMDATHLRWFTQKTIQQLFERNGFEVVRIRQSAGSWLHAYDRMPFRLLPPAARTKLVKRLNRLRPRLFGCQHVLMTRKQADG